MAVIRIPCPKCGHGNSVYTDGMDTTMREYPIKKVPIQMALCLLSDEETVECEHCHSTVSITCPALTGTVELVPIIDD